MLGLFRRRQPDPSEAGRQLGKVRIDEERARRRAMCDRLRADMFAKGNTKMTPIDWNKLL